MGAGYSHTNRPDGTTLSGSVYNADHQNHIDNATPALFDDYSANVAQMGSIADPGEPGAEILPTSLAGEIERLRHQIKEIKEYLIGASITKWYESLTANQFVPFGNKLRFTLSNGLLFQTDIITVAGASGVGATNSLLFTFDQPYTQFVHLFGVPLVSGLGSTNSEDLEHTFSLAPFSLTQGQLKIFRMVGANDGTFGFRFFAIGK